MANSNVLHYVTTLAEAAREANVSPGTLLMHLYQLEREKDQELLRKAGKAVLVMAWAAEEAASRIKRRSKK